MSGHTVVDLTAGDVVAPPSGTPHPADRREAHLLRLSLDLQLDALLCTLGAAATTGGPGGDDDDAPPGRQAGRTARFHRWLAEDLDVASRLAAVAVGVDAPLPTGLGQRLGDTRQVATDLLVRFEAMQVLLADVAGSRARDAERCAPEVAGPRPDGAARGGPPAGDGDAAVRRALVHCERRVEELRRHLAALDRSGGSA